MEACAAGEEHGPQPLGMDLDSGPVGRDRDG